MLVLAFLLQAVPAAHQDPAKPLPRILDLAGTLCVVDGCDSEPGRRFRLDSESERPESTMQRAMKGVWRACETTGAPKCPSKGRLILQAPIETY